MFKVFYKLAYKYLLVLFAVIIVSPFSLLCAQNANSQNEAGNYQYNLVKEIYQKNAKSIVKIFAAKKKVNSADRFMLVGTGFFVDKDGFVMTNATITYQAQELWIESNGEPYAAKLVGFDPITNLSIIKVDALANSDKVKAIEISNEFALPEIADTLVMISCEMGQNISPSIGMVTGHNIRFGEKILPAVYLRTNIPIYGGSCGGALFDLKGNFVGMAIASISELSSSFILPARAAKRIKDDIILCKEPVYGWFGLRTQELSDSVNGTRVVVDMVMEKGPAKKAGFELRDIICEINGKKVQSDLDLRGETFFIRPGEYANFKIKRNAEIKEIKLLVEKMPSDVVNAQMGALNQGDNTEN